MASGLRLFHECTGLKAAEHVMMGQEAYRQILIARVRCYITMAEGNAEGLVPLVAQSGDGAAGPGERAAILCSAFEFLAPRSLNGLSF